MAEEQEETFGEQVKDFPARIEGFVEDNQKAVAIGAGVVVVIIVALIYVFAKWLPDENLKAEKAMYMAELSFARDSFAVALNGSSGNNTTSFKGFAEVASKYSLTRSGKLCNYYAGICCLNLKRFDEAVKYLDKFSTSDPVVGAIKLNATGDAYAELGKFDDAISYYQKAADFSDNERYTPYFLLKTGMAYEKQKKYADAKKQYEKIKDKYPNSDEGREIDKYIARAGAGS